MRILVVEDERHLAGLLRRALEEEMHVVDLAYDGGDGLEKAESGLYDAIILDVMLPKLDGFEVCARLRRADIGTPVLMLTARDAIEDRVRGLDAGADDYLPKPFALAELLARTRALGRRRAPLAEEVLRIADLTLNSAQHRVERAGAAIDLTPKEFALLEYLMRHANRALTRAQILDHVWGYDLDTTANTVDTYIHYLRAKIDGGDGQPLIHTVRGIGYAIRERA